MKMKKIFNISVMMVFLMVGIVSADINDGLVAYQPMEPQVENPVQAIQYFIDPDFDEVDLGYNFTCTDHGMETGEGTRNFAVSVFNAFAPMTVPDLSELAEYTISYSIHLLVGGANLNVVIPLNDWYHVIVTKTQIDATTAGFRFYINKADSPILYFEDAIDVGVTFDLDGIQGWIDEIRVYDRVVGSIDRTAIYDHATAGWIDDEPVDEPVDDEPEIEPLVEYRSEPLDIGDVGEELVDSAKDEAGCFIKTLGM
jgi:hypothetical protein